MKKFSIVAVLAIMAVAFTGCGNSAPKANLKNDVDTLTYAMGMLQSQGLKDYLVGRMGMDTTYMDEFFRGLNDGANAGDDKAKAAYYAGIQIGQQVANNMIKGINHEVYGEDSTKSISLKNFLAGFIASTAGQKTLFTDMEAQVKVQTLMPIVRSKRLMKEYAPNKEAGEKFMAENKKKAGVVCLPSGVQYKVIKEGNGPIPADTSTVLVSYEGRLINGQVFDSSYKNNAGKPVQVRVKDMIPGWIDALTHMPEGSAWEIYIPQDKAYGSRDAGEMVKPFSALIFKLELVKVQK